MRLSAQFFLALPIMFVVSVSAHAAQDAKTQSSKSLGTVAVAETEKPAPSASAATANPAYMLRPGDMLHISVWKEDELDRQVLVLPDGSIDFPLIGSVQAAGNSPAALKDLITQKLKPFVPAAAVTVVVNETRGNTVSIMGQVTKPGDIVMGSNLTIMQALSQAGGLTPYADGDDIVILRKTDGKETSIEFDYGDVSRGRHLETNITLEPGDVVVVPTASLF